MKIVRYQPKGSLNPSTGILKGKEIIPFRSEDNFIDCLQTYVSKGQKALRKRTRDDKSIFQDSVDLLPPLTSRGRVFMLGGVYAGHLEDRGLPLMTDPNQWTMPENAIIGPNDPIPLPKKVADNVVPAAELCLVIGKSGKYISPEEALDYIVGYTISNDVTARTDWPGPMGYKLMDGFCPLGPHLCTKDEITNPLDLNIEMEHGGEVICKGNTAGMRFSLSFMVSYLSTITELRPGDIISTGDPGGVEGRLTPGNDVTIEIEGVGVLRNSVEMEEGLVKRSH